jgi:acyl carrier protein
VSWCPEDSGRYEALLMKRGVEGRKWRGKSSKSSRENGWRAFANDPMRKAGGESIVPELRKYLSEMLPGYMAPSVIIELTELPLTPNGKVDRKALPGPDLGLDEPEILAPRSAVEEILVRIFAEVLNIERVGIANSFFELGGHSLLATQVISRIEESLQIELPLRKLFENPTVADIAQAISQNPQQRKIAETSAELLIKLDGLSEERIEEMLDERAGGETLI